MLLKVLFQIFERFQIGVQPLFLRIRDKHDSIRAFQDQFAAGFVEDLPGHGVQVQASFKAAHGAEIERKKIKKERAIGFRRERDHFSFQVRAGVVVDPLQIGGFPAEAGTVVHELAIDFACRKVDERHDAPGQPGVYL